VSIPVVDAHNDLLLELDHVHAEETPFASRWLPVLERGGVALQVCPTFGAEPEWLSELSLRRNLSQIRAFHRAVAENGDRVMAVRTRGDLNAVERGERMGLMLSMEGVEALGYDPALVEVFWHLGVRMVSLTWNRRNPFADGAAEPEGGGLSRLGEELIDRLVGLGIMIDLAHASERTFSDVLERRGEGNVLVSHAACRSVCETPRNLSDTQLEAIAAGGGVLGIMLLPFVVDPKRLEISRAVDHIDHAVAVMGIEHVGLGGDFIKQVINTVGLREPKDSLGAAGLQWDASIPGLEGPDGYPALIEAMQERGYADDAVAAICGGNLLRFFRRGLPT
jgi:membrane dipeptidase